MGGFHCIDWLGVILFLFGERQMVPGLTLKNFDNIISAIVLSFFSAKVSNFSVRLFFKLKIPSEHLFPHLTPVVPELLFKGLLSISPNVYV